jgi:hypothetical protein
MKEMKKPLIEAHHTKSDIFETLFSSLSPHSPPDTQNNVQPPITIYEETSSPHALSFAPSPSLSENELNLDEDDEDG